MDNRIDSIIDLAAVEAEAAKVEKHLSEIATTIKTFPKAQIFYDASGTKDLATANKQLSTVMDQLKIKNLELTNSIKEQQLAEKQLSVQRKQAIADAKAKAEADKESARQAQIAGAEKIKALQAQAKAEEELAAAQKERADIGTFDIQQGSGQKGGAKLITPKNTEAAFVPANDTEASLLLLTQTQNALKGNLAAQKDLDAQLKAGTISQAKYDEQIVAAKLAESEYRKQIQLTNAELKARTNADFAIQGSIDAAKAQNAILTQQRNAIPVGEGAAPEDIARVKELNAEIDKNNELIDKNSDLLAKQKINIGNYPTALGGTFKTLNTELEQVQGKLVQGNFGGKEFDQLTAKQTVLQNALSLTGQTFKSSAAEASAYKEAAIQIGQVYGKDSSIFKQFAEGIKQGAANTKALANEVTSVATKGKGFTNFLSQAWAGIRKLAYVIPGLGIGGVVLLLLGPLQAAGASLVKWVKESTGAISNLNKRVVDYVANLKAMNEVNASANKEAGKQISTLKLLYQAATDVNLPMKERLQAVKDLKREFPDYFGQLNTEKILNGEVKQTYDDLTQSIIASSRAKAAKDKIDAIESQKLDIEQQKLKVLVATTNEYNKANEIRLKGGTFGASQVSPGGLAPTPQGSTAVNTLSQNIKEITERRDKALADLDKQNQKLQDTEDFLVKFAGIGNITDVITKTDDKKVKKAKEDSERLLDEFRKKALQAQQEFIKAQNEAELKGYKTVADDQQASLEERLAAEKKYYDKSKEITKQAIQDQIDAVNLEADLAEKKAGKIKDPKKRADTEVAIEQYRTTELKKIIEVGNAELQKDDEDYYSAKIEITSQAFDRIKRIAEEGAKFIQEQQKLAFQNQKDSVDIEKDNQLLQLDKDFQDGKIKNLEEYNEKKEAIETAADLRQKQLDLKRIQEAEKIFEALYGIQNLNLIKEAKDLEVEIEEEGNKKILDSKKEVNEKKKEFAQDLADFIESGLLSENQKQEDQLDKESQDVDKKTQKEIDAINASGLAEEEKQKRITKAQKQAAFDQEQIAKQKDKLDKQRQAIQRLAAVAEVGAQIAQEIFALNAKAAAARAEAFFLLANPLTSVLAPAAFAASAAISAQIPFVLASGGLALIKAAAFEKGTDSAPKGPAIVGEKGSELIVTKEGQMYVTPPRPTLIELAGGEQVFRHDITADFLKHHNLLHILQKAQSAKQPAKVESNFNEKIYYELRKLNNKPAHITQVTEKMEISEYVLRNIKR